VRPTSVRGFVVGACIVLGTCAIAQAQSVDTDFNPGATGPSGTVVLAVAIQTDGKILVGGSFSGLGGGTGTTPRDNIGRLNADGSVDTVFNPSVTGSLNAHVGPTVEALAVQADGKILVGGSFASLGGGASRSGPYVGRLNADGSLDTSFNPGTNGAVGAIVVQADGKILVGGAFTTLGGGGTGTTARNYLGRLNADGSLDTSFNPGANVGVAAIAIQEDGRILVGGGFTQLGGGGTGTTPRNNIGRLNADGSLDTSFNPRRTERSCSAAPSRGWAVVDSARRPAMGLGDSIPTGRSTPPSIQARIKRSLTLSCRRTARFWSAASSPGSGMAPARHRAATLADSTPTGRSTRPSTPAQAAPF
jgi:uncharacterized delta-60 repeat protein